VSRADALAALNASNDGFACGAAWLPADLLDAVAEQAGPMTMSPALALAAIASSVPVDLAFVGADGLQACDAVIALQAADIAAVWSVDGVFSRVAGTIGWVEALSMTVAEPGALAVRLDEALHEALQEVRSAFECGADAVLIADDLAGPAGPLLAPDYALDALLPCYHRLALEADAGGLPALFHSDGDVRMLLPALARAGFSAVHLAGVGADAFALSAAAARRAGLVAMGGVSAARLPDGGEEMGERAGHLAATLGGVIVADDGGITTLEQLTAFGVAIASARESYGRPAA